MERKLITKFDILLIGFVFAAIAAVLVFNYFSQKIKTPVAEIYFDGKMIEKSDLSDKTERRITTGKDESVVIIVRDGTIFFEESSCHDKICVRSKPLEKGGDFAACIPNKVIIKVAGEEKTGPDAIVY